MQSPCCLHDGPSMAALGSAEEPQGCLVLSLFFPLLFLSLLRLWVLLAASPTHKQWVYVGVSCLQGFMAADAHAGAGWAHHHSFGAVSEDLVLNLLPGGLISPPVLGSSALLLVLSALFCFFSLCSAKARQLRDWGSSQTWLLGTGVPLQSEHWQCCTWQQ